MTTAEPPDERVVLVLAPSGRDARLTHDMLENDGLAARVCDDVSALRRCILAGAAAALIAEEALTESAIEQLVEVLDAQPPWSDFPIVVFSGAGRSGDQSSVTAMRALGNVTFLDRPVQVRTMLAAVHSAVRARTRQYEGRNAIAARDRFLAMLGHELRNPLAAIRLAVQLAERHGSEWREQHTVIDRQSRHLGKLVDDLLDVARVTHGKLIIQPADVEIGEILRACVEAREATDHALTLDIPEGMFIVRGDRLRLEQVFNNLLTNALKYTPAGGSVHVRVVPEERSVAVEVDDNGVGIAPELLPRVFELFAQGSQSLARAQGGMGVGLTVVRSLVHLHGGDVDVHSDGLGRGSTFRVRLPLENAPTRASSKPNVVPQRPRRVVLVEDNDDVRTMLEQLLIIAGHDVATANDGPSGLTRILEARPDVAFVDIGLPGFDGYELARRVRARKETIRLVALTGYGQPEDRRRARDAGFDLHLTKPVGIDELEAALGE